MISQAVILCGGEGSRLNDKLRYQPILTTPKPLVEVGGKPFVTYAINMLKGVGVSDVILLVKTSDEEFNSLNYVKLVKTQGSVNQAVLSIPLLRDLFILLNGDCFPVMDWRAFVDTGKPRIAIKVVDRDAGIAVVARKDVASGRIDCSKIGDMGEEYEKYTILGGLHIGTYQGLERARQFMDLVVFGQ